MSAKPNLFIVGAPKCGTTAWYAYLRSHPDIFFPDVKEPHHFLTDFPNYPQVKSRHEYLDLFREKGAAVVLGEASPHYLLSKEAAANIFEFNRQAKILIFVRDQADYLESLFNQYLYGGMECLTDFRRAWELSEARSLRNVQPPFKEPGLLNYRKSAHFSPQVERYFSLFPPKQIRVFHFSDWTRDPRRTYLEILRFLEVQDDGRTEFPRVNEAHQRRFPFLLNLVRNPPAPIRRLVEWLRKLTGRAGLGLGTRLLRANTRSGRHATIDPELRAEIARHYQRDNELLKPRIWSSVQNDAQAS